MKYLVTYSIILFLSIPYLFGQKVYSTAPIKFSHRSEDFNILGKEDNKLYLHIYGNKVHEVYAFRENMGLKWHKYLGFDHKRFDYSQIFFDEGKFTFFYTRKERNNRILYGTLYNPELIPDTQLVMIDTLFGKFGKIPNDLEYIRSENRDKILIYYIEEVYNKNDIFRYILIDHKLSVIDKGTIILQTKNKRTVFEEVMLENTGKFHIVLGEYRTSSYNHASRFWVLSSETEFEKFGHLEVEAVEGNYLNNTKFKVDNNNRSIVVTGFYSDGAKGPAYAVGIFFKVIDLDSVHSTVSQFAPFPKQFLNKLRGANSKNTNRLYTFTIDKILLRQDGGALVIAESNYQSFRSSSDMYSMYGTPSFNENTITYHFDELLIANMSPNGEMDWKLIILKNQYSTGDYGRYSSYCIMNNAGFLNFIFNDNISSRTNVINFIVKADGESDREILLNSKQMEVYMQPQYGIQISTGEIVIPSVKGNELKLVKLDYSND